METPQNPLHERYASRDMARLFTASHRFGQWRKLWITLARCQQELGLAITDRQLDALERSAPPDLERVAQLERETRHDVVAHLRHFKEQADEVDAESGAGGILHLGATSAFITDNTDMLLFRDALRLLEGRLVATIRNLSDFARRHKDVTCLAYTHFQPAQLTTVGKRACLWTQDFVLDLIDLRDLLDNLRCRGVKGTTGTQASYVALFDDGSGVGVDEKIRQLDRRFAERLDFAGTFAVTGQTYSRKQDSRMLHLLARIAESAHKFGTDLRLLQGVGELSEPFDENQVGSSAMAYKRNPVRAERLCGLSRRLMTDSLNGPLNTATQWLERSLDDSSNRRLVLPDALLGADAVLGLASHIGQDIRLRPATIAARLARELPFMATEKLLMEAVKRGGDRQELHEALRVHSLEAQEAVEKGQANPLIDSILADSAFPLEREEVEAWLRPEEFRGRSPRQVDEFLDEVVEPLLRGARAADVESPRV